MELRWFTSARPCARPPWLKEKYGIDLDEEVDEVYKEIPIQNCYCMDTTIIPEPWGLPPTVTVVAMVKRLASRLTVDAEAKVAVQEPA